jgi:hypothetical protein
VTSSNPAEGINPLCSIGWPMWPCGWGLDLQPGQDLILQAPVEALPLVRRIAERAYMAGAGEGGPNPALQRGRKSARSPQEGEHRRGDHNTDAGHFRVLRGAVSIFAPAVGKGQGKLVALPHDSRCHCGLHLREGNRAAGRQVGTSLRSAGQDTTKNVPARGGGYASDVGRADDRVLGIKPLSAQRSPTTRVQFTIGLPCLHPEFSRPHPA